MRSRLAHRRRAVRAHVDEGPTFLDSFAAKQSPTLPARRHNSLSGPWRLLSRSGLLLTPAPPLRAVGGGCRCGPGQRGRPGARRALNLHLWFFPPGSDSPRRDPSPLTSLPTAPNLFSSRLHFVLQHLFP